MFHWLDAIKKIRHTHKKDILWRLQTEARKLMKLSAKAVPVWIMPLAAAAENFDPTATRFDVVIIDEASQADLNALVAIYQADKIIVEVTTSRSLLRPSARTKVWCTT
jgi:superfamily I DNA and/or RNA helicase